MSNAKPYDWKPLYLEALRHIPVVTHGCEAADVHRTTVMRARNDDPEFAEAEKEAMEAGIDRAEQEAFRRGVVGFEEPVIHQGRAAWQYKRVVKEDGSVDFEPVLDAHGQPVLLTVRKHSDAMLSLMLKGRRKKVFADRTELTGAEGAPVVVDETKRSARVAQLLAMAQARKTEADEFGDLA